MALAANLIKMTAVRNTLYRQPCPEDCDRYADFERKFEYEPTADQKRCFEDIREDMISRTRPMDRLICGDVGFGKFITNVSFTSLS
jgi:transcription-repair coupling factor (superfamily II helicase)